MQGCCGISSETCHIHRVWTSTTTTTTPQHHHTTAPQHHNTTMVDDFRWWNTGNSDCLLFYERPGLAVTCLVTASPEEHGNLYCVGDGFVDACSRSDYGVWEFHFFYVKVDLGSRGRFRRAYLTWKSGLLRATCIWQSAPDASVHDGFWTKSMHFLRQGELGSCFRYAAWFNSSCVSLRRVSLDVERVGCFRRNAAFFGRPDVKTKREGTGLQDLLQDWVSQLAPPTAVDTPQSFRQRVAQLMARQIRRAADATMAAHVCSVSTMRDSLEAKALLEHQLLWAMPAFLTRRMPDQHETERDTAKKPNRAEGIQRLKQHGARVRKGEQGLWTELLQEALQELETTHGRLEEDAQQAGHT